MAYKIIKGANKITGDQTFVNNISGSTITASYFVGNGSLLTNVAAVTSQTASNADLFDGRDSITFAGTGSNTFNGNQIVTGTITSTSAISGTTGLFTTVTSSQSLVSNVLSVGNYLQILPVGSVSLPADQTASYIYTSGSTNDMYFTQYQPGTNYTNTTRLRWIEGALSTGLLHGGTISTVNGTTTFNLTSGSGIIVSYNASLSSDPYPTIKYVTWNNFVSQSLIYSASAPITYVAIDENGAISQTNTAFTPAQFKDRIVIGRVLHQSGAVTNGTTTAPTTAYAVSSNTQDFFRSFGPLKVSGHVLTASGSTMSVTKTTGDSYVEGRNYTLNPNQPNYISSTNDPAMTTTKIFYEWVSGSTTFIDNNGGAGYTQLFANRYNLNGTITTISPTNNKFTIQRAYWFPKSATGALYVYYGSTIYTSLSDAITAITDEPNFIESSHTLSSAIYVGAIVLEANTSDLTITTKAKIVNGGLFRGTGGGGGGGGGSTSPGGSNHEIQFNDSGVFNGSANLTFDTTTLTLNGKFNMTGTGSLNVSSTISSSNYIGSGQISSSATAIPGGYISRFIFGDGSDGTAILDATASVAWASLASTTYTMTRDAYLENLTVNAGVTVKINNWLPYVRGTLTNNGTIESTGNDASGGTAGAAVTAAGTWNCTTGAGGVGVSINSIGNGGSGSGGNSLGGGGGNGGAAGANAGGGGNTSAAMSSILSNHRTINLLYIRRALGNVSVNGSGGGGSGGAINIAGASTATSGGGGSGAPTCGIAANILINNNIIRSRGGNGGNAVSAGTASAGGGGGGSGGLVYVVANVVQVSGTITSIGGSGGNGSNGGATGSVGTGGTIILLTGSLS